MRYATRMNSFLRTGKTVPQALEEIGAIDGVDYVDLNYPEHFRIDTTQTIQQALAQNGLKLNAINLRFRDIFLNGVFTNVQGELREQAVQLCREAAGTCRALGGQHIIVWLNYDGYDYSFQMDYVQAWERMVECFRLVCDATDYPVSIEYKPYEERVHPVLDSYGTTMLMVQEIGRDNLGVTLDFCHMLMKHENPSFATAMLLQKKKLFAVHLNDGEGRTDDGLMVGAINPWKTLEMFYYLKKYAFKGVIYFDTFPKREDAAEECAANYAMCKRMEGLVDKLGVERIENVVQQNDAVAVMNLLMQTWE